MPEGPKGKGEHNIHPKQYLNVENKMREHSSKRRRHSTVMEASALQLSSSSQPSIWQEC